MGRWPHPNEKISMANAKSQQAMGIGFRIHLGVWH